MKGYTLLEMLIAAALVAIVALIALPGYQGPQQKAREAEARAALLEVSHYMQGWYSEHGAYHHGGSQWPTLPVAGTPHFDIAFSTVAPTSDNVEQESFLIYTTPKTEAAGDAMLKLDQDGNIRRCTQPADGPERCEG